jgi:hypothetical protein
MKKTILLLLLCLLASCKCASPEVTLSNEASKLYTDEVTKVIECIEKRNNNEECKKTIITNNKVQVLYVNSYTIRNDQLIRNVKDKYISETTIQLNGKAMDDTSIEKTFIRFVDNDASLDEPRYDTSRNILQMQLKYNQLPAFLASLNDKQSLMVCVYGEVELQNQDDKPYFQKFAQFYCSTNVHSSERNKPNE